MSEPTYLIRVRHEPGFAETTPWAADVIRLSDDSHAVTRWGTTQEEAVTNAQKWIRANYGAAEPPREFYADEDGTIAVGESVRVLRQP